MIRCRLTLYSLAAWVFWASVQVEAQSTTDRVQRRNGVDSGAITATTPLGVTISKGGVTSKIPAEDIRSILYQGEPAELNAARNQFDRGRYDTALERLKKIDPAKITREEIRQDLDFYLAACNANLALAGQGDIKQALAEIGAFQTTHRTSFHVPQAIELHGDLYLAGQDFVNARKKYETLAKAPASFYKARSAMLVGKLLQEQGQHAEAIPQFETAITTAGAGSATADIRREATFGKAISLAATGKLKDAITAVKEVVQRTPVDETDALAQGYNALGACYLAAGDAKGARTAYLHVDLLFDSVGDEHAEALFRLSKIWEELSQTARAEDARQRLAKSYPLSRWAGRGND